MSEELTNHRKLYYLVACAIGNANLQCIVDYTYSYTSCVVVYISIDCTLPEHIICRDLHVVLTKYKIDKYFEVINSENSELKNIFTLKMRKYFKIKLLPEYDEPKIISDIITLLKLKGA